MPADSDALTQFDEDWDAGELGCGDLLLRLRFRLKAMRPGRRAKSFACARWIPERRRICLRGAD
jgi:hypothetical protein